MRILIFYVRVGGGHESLAQAFKEKLFDNLGNNLIIELIDPIPKIVGSTYQLTTLDPKLYNLLYRYATKPLPIKLIRQTHLLFHQVKTRKIINSFKPDLIISTTYFFSGELKQILELDNIKCPIVSYVSDPFTPHPIMFHPDADLILTFNKKHLPDLALYQISEQKILPIGWPLRKEFNQKYDRKIILQRLKLNPNKFTILFGASGSGTDYLERIAVNLLKLKLNYQGIFACGSNIILEKALELIFKYKSHIRILSKLDARSMAQIMQSCDLFVGKAGPNVLFECLSSNLVPIATPPILAQELGNRNFIKQQKIGFLTENSNQTIHLLKEVIQNPKRILSPQSRLDQVKKDFLIQNEGFQLFIEWIKKRMQ